MHLEFRVLFFVVRCYETHKDPIKEVPPALSYKSKTPCSFLRVPDPPISLPTPQSRFESQIKQVLPDF